MHLTMHNTTRAFLRRILFPCLILSIVGVGVAPRTTLAYETPTVPAERDVTEQHRTLIENKIDFYNKAFPDILFTHLEGDENWHGEMVALVTALGNDAVPLDYQHPPELRQQLMEQTLERLIVMLRKNIISATTFRLGKNSVLDRPNLCVVTLNPGRIIASDLEATRYMLDLSAEVIGKVHPARHLNHDDHLSFAVDHEVYHCLDSILFGGAPMTHKELGGEYNLFLRESAADTFALGLHVKRNGVITPYARNITHIRALWLFSDSPNRCTFESMREIHKTGVSRLATMSIREIANLAHEIAGNTAGSYDDYVTRRVAALKAARILGLNPNIYGEAWGKLEKQESDAGLVGFLVNRYRFYYEQLFTDKPVPLEAPSLGESFEKH